MVFGQKLKILIPVKNDAVHRLISRVGNGTNFSFIGRSCEEYYKITTNDLNFGENP